MVTKIAKNLFLQKIKWEKAIAKPITSIVEPILIWVYHHPHGGLGPKNQRTWILLKNKTWHVYSGINHPHSGVPYLVTLIAQGQWLYT